MQINEPNDLDIIITNYRKMFRRIIVLFIMVTICTLYFYYRLSQITPPNYFVSNESGVLEKKSSLEFAEISGR